MHDFMRVHDTMLHICQRGALELEPNAGGDRLSAGRARGL